MYKKADNMQSFTFFLVILHDYTALITQLSKELIYKN